MVFEESRRDEMLAEIRRFTARQWEVTRLLADGYSYKEIALDLGISPHTVNTHVKTILRRLRLSGSRRLAALVSSMREAESACEALIERTSEVERRLPA
jgi:DNA-binding NarL/FixJ family response regulator